MKKIWKSVSLCLLLSLLSTGCQSNSSSLTSEDKVHVTFDENYQGGKTKTVEIDYNDVVSEPEDPVRTNYAFDGWFLEKACLTKVDFEEALTSDATFYAGWTRTNVTVNFLANYEGGKDSSSTIKVNESVSEPKTPLREGYLFNGWYLEKETKNLFDFTTLLKDDLSLYAGWKEDTGDNVTITYMWNYSLAPDDGVFDSVTIQKNSKTTSLNPKREGYLFVGWYLDENGSQAFDFTKRINESVTLYACWYKENVFEAEYIDVSKIDGKGYSGEASGTKVIEKDIYHASASNGYYLSWLYNPGIKLVFNVHAENALKDVYLDLRLSAEYYLDGLTLSDDEFKVEVNDQKLSFDDMVFDLTGVEADSKLPFSDIRVGKNVNLNKGDNKVVLTINNDTKYAGTMYAKAPMVDCIKLYGKEELSWAQGFPLTSNLEGK